MRHAQKPLPSGDHMRALVAAELDRIADPTRRATLERCLTDPERCSLRWSYGPDDQVQCWRVGRWQSPDGAVELAYCNRGFGPAFPWGFVLAETGSMGMDAQWHSGLEDAAICCGLLEAPHGYEVPGPREE